LSNLHKIGKIINKIGKILSHSQLHPFLIVIKNVYSWRCNNINS